MSLGGKGGRYVGLTILLTSYPNFLEMWAPPLPGTFRVSPCSYMDCFTFDNREKASQMDVSSIIIKYV